MESKPISSTIYHLEMLDPKALCPRESPLGFEVALNSPPLADFNCRLYRLVGQPWQWTDRGSWSHDRWEKYVLRSCLETWVGRLDGETIGYFELESQDDGNIEIVYFGLLPEFIGRGLGGALLTSAIRRAWDKPSTRRLWVHTCEKDHQHALENYQKRGFTLFKTERSSPGT
jgi:GNAT superfamily N-acetyltransferase